jgi:hypothetical protein
MGSRRHWGTIRKLPSGTYQARWGHQSYPEDKKGCKTFQTRYLAETFLQSKARELGHDYSEYKKARGKRIRSYGITEQDFAQMMYDQDGKCYLCQGDNGDIALCIDHDHKTGQVRGLLCNKCNRALGLFSDDPALLIKGADYLMHGVIPIARFRIDIPFEPLRLVVNNIDVT